MNAKSHPFGLVLAILLTPWLCLTTAAATAGQGPSSVKFAEGVPQVQAEGQWVPLEKELELNESIKVQTNGTFTVEAGAPRQLKEGQVLRQDGYLINTDGTLAPVYDRITAEKIGVVTLYRNGAGSRLTQPYKLPNGTQISPDGTMVLPNGTMRRLLPGQMLKLNGTSLEAKDSVTLREGAVYVQKEGQQYKVEANRTFTMNDGTKVYGSGRIVKMNGDETTLQEGEVLTLPGVVAK